MAALTFPTQSHKVDSIHLDWGSVPEGEDGFPDIRSLMAADTAVLYLMAPESCELRAIAARCGVPTRVKKASSTIGITMSDWIEALEGPTQGHVSDGPFLERFPEAMQHRLKQLAIFPLRHGELVGLLTIGRISETSFQPVETAAAECVARRLATVIGQNPLRYQVSDRLWISRVKEILRTHSGPPAKARMPVPPSHTSRERFTMFRIEKEVAGA